MSHLPSIVFYAMSALVVLTAIAVVVARNVFYGAMALVTTLTGVAGLFFILGADFLGTAQILVYVGGIMIIMLFVIMFSQRPLESQERQTNDQWFRALCLSLVIGLSLVRGFRVYMNHVVSGAESVPTSSSLGRLLLGDMLLPFEAVSLILLAALVGAVLFGQDKKS